MVLLYSIAGLLAACMVAVCAWALLADRSRGRRRCPKCFHAMDPAIGLVCPECGRDAREEMRLFRTRRRWKVAVLALLLLGTPAVVTGGLARVKQTGGWTELPSWALVRLAWVEDDGLDAIIMARCAEGELEPVDGARWMAELIRRLRGGSEEQTTEVFAHLKKLAEIDDARPSGRSMPLIGDAHTEELTEALLPIASRPGMFQQSALFLLGRLRNVDHRATWAVMEALGSGDLVGYTNARSVLTDSRTADAGPERTPRMWSSSDPASYGRGHYSHWPSSLPERPPAHPVDVLAGGLQIEGVDKARVAAWGRRVWSGEERLISGWDRDPAFDRMVGLWLLCHGDEFGDMSLEAVLTTLGGEDPESRVYAAGLLTGFEWSERVEAAVRDVLGDSNIDGATRLRIVTSFGLRASALRSEVMELISDSGAWEQRSVAPGSSLVQPYLANLSDLPERIGVSEAELRSAYAAGLNDWCDRLGEQPAGWGLEYEYGNAFWITLLRLREGRDEQVAAAIRRYIHLLGFRAGPLAALTYATYAPDAEDAEQLVMECCGSFSARHVATQKVVRRLVHPRYIAIFEQALLDHDSDGVVMFLRRTNASMDTLRTYESLLREVAGDESNPMRHTAQYLLNRVDH